MNDFDTMKTNYDTDMSGKENISKYFHSENNKTQKLSHKNKNKFSDNIYELPNLPQKADINFSKTHCNL